MKETELRKFAQCCMCQRKIGQLPLPIFHIVKVERFGLDMAAVNRQQGLAMMMGGNGMLASVMGPDQDMATSLATGKTMICDECMVQKLPEVFEAYEAATQPSE